MTWIINNIGTIFTLAVLTTAVILIIMYMRKNKRMGKTSCGCGCKNCAMRGTCHGQK